LGNLIRVLSRSQKRGDREAVEAAFGGSILAGTWWTLRRR